MRFDPVGVGQMMFESVLRRSGPFRFEQVKTGMSRSGLV